MDFEKLHSGVPEAQKRVEDHRAFDLKVATVSKVRERLQEKLSGTISFFSEVVEEFPGEPIIIERIDPSSKEDSASGAIGGITVIELEGLNKDGGPATTGNIGPFAVVGYELTFTFLPFREGFSGEIDSARKVPRGTETTLSLEEDRELWDSLHKEDFPRVAEFTSIYASYPDSEGKFRDYVEKYLPKRTQQVMDLQASANLIGTSMENKELNPRLWDIREKRKLEEQLQAEEAARLLQAQQEEAHRIVNSHHEYEDRRLQEFHTRGSKPRGLRWYTGRRRS